jgi:hypothetical protein
MKQAVDVHAQLCDYWKNLKWEIESCLDDEEGDKIQEGQRSSLSYDAVRKCFLSGYFSQTAILMPNGGYQSLLDQRYMITLALPSSSSPFLIPLFSCTTYFFCPLQFLILLGKCTFTRLRAYSKKKRKR